jgi:MFS family permease
VGAVVVLFSIGGFAASTRGIASTLIFQRWAPDHLRARTFAAMSTANWGAIGVAMTVSGIVLAALTPAGVCIASGILGLCALLIATRVPPRRRDTADVDGAVTETVRPSRSEWSLAT